MESGIQFIGLVSFGHNVSSSTYAEPHNILFYTDLAAQKLDASGRRL
jgi:hypothetical protein